jgi:hypothetical protein
MQLGSCWRSPSSLNKVRHRNASSLVSVGPQSIDLWLERRTVWGSLSEQLAEESVISKRRRAVDAKCTCCAAIARILLVYLQYLQPTFFGLHPHRHNKYHADSCRITLVLLSLRTQDSSLIWSAPKYLIHKLLANGTRSRFTSCPCKNADARLVHR